MIGYKDICSVNELMTFEGELSSPHYPYKYETNLNCTTRITVPAGHVCILFIHQYNNIYLYIVLMVFIMSFSAHNWQFSSINNQVSILNDNISLADCTWPIQTTYTLRDQGLHKVSEAKYLGVTIFSNLSRVEHTYQQQCEETWKVQQKRSGRQHIRPWSVSTDRLFWCHLGSLHEGNVKFLMPSSH